MSVAPQLPPVVYIPPRARRDRSGRAGTALLTVVPAPTVESEASAVPVEADEQVAALPALVLLPAPEPATGALHSEPAAVRLTARGRAVLVAAALLIAAAVVALAWAGATAPNTEPRREIDLLQRLNHLPAGQLTPGQRLRTR